MDDFFGVRLRIARRKAGFTTKELAGRIEPSLSAQAIGRYERGEMLPRSGVLVQLSRILGVSMEFLFGGQVEAITGIEFRRKSAANAQDWSKVEGEVIEQLKNYFLIEDILELPHSRNALGEFGRCSISDWQDVDDAAMELRSCWKLGSDPISDVVSLLESQAIKVLGLDAPEGIDGFSCFARLSGNRTGAPIVALSNSTTLERRRLGLARELAHHVLDRPSHPDITLERAAQRFAGAFLAPADHLRSQTGRGRLSLARQEVITLKRIYGISAAALLVRAEEAEILPASSVKRAFRTYARTWRVTEPALLVSESGFPERETPLRYRNLVWRALTEKIITPYKASKMLQIPLDEVALKIPA